jgi:sodium-dependent dicarboxylate transporter 2/3/5
MISKIEFNKYNILLGFLGFIIFLVFPISESNLLASNMFAIAVLMAIWWITEAIPIAATSLVPLVLIPLFGIDTGKQIAGLYFNSIVFLFVGGFLIAIAMERWGLHKRIALSIIDKLGTNPRRIVLGFMLSSFLLSMFISNTATTIMMLPIGLGIISKLENDFSKKETRKFSIALMLGIAYSSSVGGTATLIGTAPNLAFKSIYESMITSDIAITFSNWFIFALPLAVITFIVVKIFILNVFYKPSKKLKLDKDLIRKELKSLGKFKYEERVVLISLITASILWMFRTDISLGNIVVPGWSNLLASGGFIDDGTVSIFVALMLFIIPSKDKKKRRILGANAIDKMPWNIIILFGGGFALAYGFESTGLSELIGSYFVNLSNVPQIIIIIVICLLMTFVTELTSNTATTYTMLPIIASISFSLNINSLEIMIPATIAASYAFMFPVATPPNAIVFSSNKIKIKDMTRIGFVLNIITVTIAAIYSSLFTTELF